MDGYQAGVCELYDNLQSSQIYVHSPPGIQDSQMKLHDMSEPASRLSGSLGHMYMSY